MVVVVRAGLEVGEAKERRNRGQGVRGERGGRIEGRGEERKPCKKRKI